MLTRALEREGVDTVFGTVGHGNLAFVDALIDSSIRYVPVLHEQVGAHAADAFFRVSGRVGVVTTTVGPGFTNLATGLGDALLDSSAMVVIAGGIPSSYIGREPLQELRTHADDQQTELFRGLSKRVIRAWRADDLARLLHEAVAVALSGCPGPVILHVPMDFFSTPVPLDSHLSRPAAALRPAADPTRIAEAAQIISEAERPVLYAGGGAVLSGAGAAVLQIADSLGIPVATTMSGQGIIPETHERALGFTGVVGTRPANRALREADVVIAVGTRFPEMDTSSWSADYFAAFPPARLVQIDIDAAQIDKVFESSVAILSDATAALRSLLDALGGQADALREGWRAWRDRLAVSQREWAAELEPIRTSGAFPFEPAELLAQLREQLPADLNLVTGVGIRHLVGQHFPVLAQRGQVVASGFGTMGQEVAAAIGAAIGRPDRPTVAIVGDGAIMACLAALPSAALAGIHAVWIVLNNNGYGSIAIYQSKHFNRHVGTSFDGVHGGGASEFDYAAIGKSLGMRSTKVGRADELRPALVRALAEPAPWLIEVPVTETPRVLASGHWVVNDILSGAAFAADGSERTDVDA
nr:thiamine pyrophosphate-binding protein [Microbacterium ulmi]